MLRGGGAKVAHSAAFGTQAEWKALPEEEKERLVGYELWVEDNLLAYKTRLELKMSDEEWAKLSEEEQEALVKKMKKEDRI